MTYLVGAVLILFGSLSFGNARKTESRGGVPAAVAAAYLAFSAVMLALVACAIVFAIGPLGWMIEGGYTIASLVQARSAYGRLNSTGRTTTDPSSTGR